MSYIEDNGVLGEVKRDEYSLGILAKLPFLCLMVLGLLTIGLLMPLAIIEWFRIVSIEQGSTNRRIYSKKYLFSSKSEEMKIEEIASVISVQSKIQEFFNNGSVIVTSKDGRQMSLEHLSDPVNVMRDIDSMIKHEVSA